MFSSSSPLSFSGLTSTEGQSKSGLQIFTVLSSDAETITDPSGATEQSFTSSLCPLSVVIHFFDLIPHNFKLESKEAATTIELSGVTAQPCTPSQCPLSVDSHSPVWMFHNLTPSEEVETIVEPS